MNLSSTMTAFGRQAWKHPKVRRAGLAALAVALLDLVVLAFVWAPAAWDCRRLERNIFARRESRMEAQRALDTARAFGDLDRRARALQVKWETTVTQAELVESLTRAAAKRHLKVLSQDFEVKTLTDNGKVLEENLTLAGGYPALREFLEDVGNLSTLTVVRQARLEKGGPGGDGLRATLLLATYQRNHGGA